MMLLHRLCFSIVLINTVTGLDDKWYPPVSACIDGHNTIRNYNEYTLEGCMARCENSSASNGFTCLSMEYYAHKVNNGLLGCLVCLLL